MEISAGLAHSALRSCAFSDYGCSFISRPLLEAPSLEVLKQPLKFPGLGEDATGGIPQLVHLFGLEHE